MNMKRWILTIAGCLMVIGLLGGYKAMQISSAIAEFEAMPEHSEAVSAVAVKAVEYQPMMSVLGVAVTPLHIELHNELPGLVMVVNHTSGAAVKKGDVIFQLDVREETAQLKAERARRKLAKAVVGRTQKLHDSNAISQEQLDQAEAELAIVEANIDRWKSAIAKKTIRAPFDGVIGIHDVRVGEYLAANEPLAQLVGDQGYSFVDFQIPQFYAPLELGEAVNVRQVRSSTTEFVPATVVATNQIMEAGVRSMRYRAKVPNAALFLAANTAVEVQAPVADPVSVQQVLTTAVLNDAAGAYVYILDEDAKAGGHRAVRKPVTVVANDETNTFIEPNLKVGQRIAATGAFKLYDGVLVNITEPPSEKRSPALPAIAQGDQ